MSLPDTDGAHSIDSPSVDPQKEGLLPRMRSRIRRVLAFASIALLAQSAALLLLAETVRRRRRNEETIRRLVQRINLVREEEQLHLARELHDNLGQRLSLLSIRLGTLRNLRSSSDPVFGDLEALGRELDDLISEVHKLSHSMHSSRREILGLEGALRELCKDVSLRGRIEAVFQVKEDLGEVSPSVSLCFYRIAQEALNNVLKHSGASRAELVLNRAKEQLAMQVIDDGVGFHPGMVSHGLGLTSIRERILSANGSLSVVSSPGEGTTISIQAPAQDCKDRGSEEAGVDAV